jgi:non-ribosomal peptide synthetase component F/aryl carrier-like protein
MLDEWTTNGQLYNLYGPTEATIGCTLNCKVPEQAKPSQIGPAFPHCSLYVIKDDKVQPKGAVGELCVGGPHVTRGYCKRPDVTAKSFVVGYAGIEERLYRTGDLCRMLNDGSIEFLGRNDDQVKLRGLRIQLSEIDSTLQNVSEAVQDSVSLVLKHPAIGRDQIVTFVVAKDSDLNTNEVIRLCSTHLAPYMVPSHVVKVNQIPLTVSGKCDRITLKKLFYEMEIEDEIIDFEPNEDQELFKEVVARYLGVESQEISWSRSLIAYGIDSITSAILSSQLRKEGYMITSIDIMKATSLKDLVEKMEGATSSAIQLRDTISETLSTFRTLQEEVIQNHEISYPIKRILPATPLQAGLVSITLTSDIPMYYNFTVLRLEDQTNVDLLVESFRKVIGNNDIYQTGFLHTSNTKYPLVQVVYDGFLDFVQNHQTEIDSLETLKLMEQEWIMEEPLRSLKLPPIRLDTFKTESERFLVFAIHHGLYDGWSLTRFFEQVAQYYEDQRLQDNAEYDPFVAYIYSKDPETEKEFWKSLFQDHEFVEIPVLSTSDSPVETVHRLSRSSKIPKDLLQSKCREWNVTPQAVVQAGWINVLTGILGTSNVTFGQLWSGRNIPMDGAMNTFGPLLNTVPFSYTKKEGMGDLEMIGEVHRLNMEVLDRCFTPLREIMKWTERSTLFDNIFLFQIGGLKDHSMNQIWNAVDGNFRMEFPLAISVVLEETLEFDATGMSSRIDLTHLEMLMNHLEDQICRFVGLESEGQLLSVYPAQKLEMQNNLLVHEYVGYWAKRIPDHIAVEFLPAIDDQVELLSYRELEELSNQVAHYVVKENIRRDDIVMVCMERNVFLYAILVGVLKAGGGYSFLEPKLPDYRKEHMIEDSGSKIILCSDESMQFIPERFKNKVRRVLRSDLADYAITKPDLVNQTCDLAYVIYTSGSTGVPKGVMVEHGNVQALMNASDELIPLDPQHRFLQFASVAFDVSVFDIFYCFMKGARLVTAPQQMILDNFADVVNRLQVTHMDLTPTVASLLPSQKSVPSVEVIVTMGEKLTQSVIFM